MSKNSAVIIGVDPHKLSATIEVIDRDGALLGRGRYRTDRAGYAAMKRYVSQIGERVEDRMWAVEGANGAGRSIAQRLLADGELVVDVPAKLAARVRLFDTGHNRKTDALSTRTRSRWSRSAPRGCGCWSPTGSSRRCGCSRTATPSSRGAGSKP